MSLIEELWVNNIERLLLINKCVHKYKIHGLFIYVSPRELGKDRIMNGEGNIDFGLIKEHSMTHEVYSTFISC